MAEQNRTVRTIIGFQYDGSAKPVIAAYGQVNATIQQTTTLVRELQATDQKPLVGLINYAKSAGIMSASTEEASKQTEVLSSDLLTLEANADKAAAGLERVSRAKVPKAEFPTFSNEELGFSGQGRGGGLSRFGSKIRSLPSTPIPGTGIATDAIGNILRVVGAIPLAAIPAIVALGGLVGVIKSFADRAPDMTAGIRDIIALDKTYYEARIKGTKDSISAIIEQKELEQKIAQARVDDLSFVKQGYDEMQGKLGGFLGGVSNGIIEITGALGGKNFKDVRDARIEYDKAQEELKKANKELGLYNGLIDDQSTALNTAAEAQKKAAESGIQRTISQASDQAKLEVEIATLKREGSEKDLEAKRKTAQADKDTALINANIIGEQLKNAKEGSLAQQQYQEEFGKLIQQYNDASLRLDALGNSALEAAVKLNDANETAKKIREDEANAVIKFNEDVKSLNAKKAEDELNLYNELIDKQVSIADKSVEDAEKAYNTLIEKQGTLGVNLNRTLEDQGQKAGFDALQRQIKFGRQEVAEEQKTKAQIVKIQQDALNKEFELGLDRTFAQLAASRRQTSQQLAQVNQQANNDRAARLQKFADENTDQQAQFAFDRQQKIEKYQQDLDDAKAAEIKQLATIEAEKQKQLAAAINAYNQEYNAIQTKFNREIAARQAAIQAELNLIAGGEQAKNSLLQQAYQQAQNIIRGVFNLGGSSVATGTGSNTTSRIVATRAGGGKLNAGQSSWVNEQGSSGMESFTNSSGQTWDIPGMGIFTPYGSGNVNANTNNNPIFNFSINVQGADAKAVITEANRQAQGLITYTLERMNARTA